MSAQPLVTIGLPVYNAQRTLADAIASIINQTYPNWELLLMDDGSADASASIARRFADPRIRWISDGSNRGISHRLNQAVALAQGEFFCRMDADDLSFPQRLQAQVDVLQADARIDLAGASVLTFTSDGRLGGVVPVAADHEQICSRPWNGFHLPHPTWMGRTAWFRAHRYSSAADGAEDQQLLYRSFEQSRFCGIPEVLLAYRDDRRSFRKLLGRRLRFWQVFAASALARGRMRDALLISVRQPAKIGADFLFVYLGLKQARNRLSPASAAQQKAWEALSSQVIFGHSV